MIKRIFVALGGVLLAGCILVQEHKPPQNPSKQDLLPTGDKIAGRMLARQCSTCHGLDGFAKIPLAPHIGGEAATYLANQLLAFRSGKRTHEMMTVVTRTLSDQQIADVAAWYTDHTPQTALPKNQQNAAPKACVACHGIDGIALQDDVPNLAGETNIYIEKQLKAFRSTKRSHAIMNAVAANMTDSEIRAAANWYGAVQLTIRHKQVQAD